MNAIILLLSDYTFQTVALGSVLLGFISGVLGSFAMLRKQSLLGDGVSHAALPGIAAAFLLTGSKNTEILLLGALCTGLFATFLIITIVKNSQVAFDSALTLVMSVFFGIGLILLTYVQKIPNANQAGLKRFIYGQASALLQRDILLMLICGAVLLISVGLLWKEFQLITFDLEYASVIGLPVGRLNLFLSFLIVLAIIIGLQTVGVVLMSAMLIAPAVAARQWCSRLGIMVILSAVFGAVSGATGTVVSSIIPNLPTGPVIVVCISSITGISLLIAPKRGILSRMIQQSRNRTLVETKRGDTDSTSI